MGAKERLGAGAVERGAFAHARGNRARRLRRVAGALALMAAVLSSGLAGSAHAAAPPTGNPGASIATAPAGAVAGSMSAGGYHTCGIRTNGAVACRGANEYGQATPPTGKFKAVSAGDFHTCGLRTNGILACWGDSAAGATTPPSGTFTAVNAGFLSSCGVRTNGTLACWGDNQYGEATPPAGTFTAVTAPNLAACGLRTNGTLACWGDNQYGEATPPAGAFRAWAAAPATVTLARSGPTAPSPAGATSRPRPPGCSPR